MPKEYLFAGSLAFEIFERLLRNDCYGKPKKFLRGPDNGNSNAFKHAFGSACLARSAGIDFATRFQTAHELPNCQDDNNRDEALHNTNDLFNNSFGLELIKNNSHLPLNEIDKIVLEAVCSGHLSRVIYKNGSGHRIPTDCSDHTTSVAKIAEAERKADQGQCAFLEVGGIHVGFPDELKQDNGPGAQNRIGPSLGGVGSGIALKMQTLGAVVTLSKETWLLVNVRGVSFSNQVGWMRRAHLRPRHGVCQP